MLLDSISKYEGTIDDFIKEIRDKYHYIEVQLWNDDCICKEIPGHEIRLKER